VSFEIPRTLAEEAIEWPPELEHVSASSFKMLARCPEQWRQRYVLGKKVPPALALLVGGADHAAIEHSMRQKVDSAVDLPLSEVKERFLEELESRVDNLGGIGEVEVPGADTKPKRQAVYDDERKIGPEVVGVYHTRVSPTLQPLEVEKEFSITVPGVPVPVVGYIDMVAAPAQGTLMDPGQPAIIERKRKGPRGRRKPEPDWTMQGEVYQLAVPEPYHFHMSFATRDPFVLTPGNDPELAVPLAPRKRSERMVAQMAAEIAFYYVRFGPDEVWPAKGKLHTWACGYCGYRADCWAWKT
jgi:hypothetical protein